MDLIPTPVGGHNILSGGGGFGSAGGPAQGRWVAVLSLGSSCAIAYHLHRKGLAKRTGPLDWFGSRNPEAVAKLVRTGFSSLMERHAISVQGEHNGYWRVLDEANSVFTLHDFPIVGRKPRPLWPPPVAERLRRIGDRLAEPAWRFLPWLRFPGPGGTTVALPGFPEFRRRIVRRVGRFAATLENPGPLLLIRRTRGDGEAGTIFEAVREIRAERPTTFLVLGSADSPNVAIGNHELRSAPMPPEDPTVLEAWRGRDEEWDRLLDGCTVGPQD